MTAEELIKLAKEQCQKSYSPYSHFSVGAALVTKSGKVYTGCNIENASYGATICAERCAIFKAVSEGDRDIEMIAVVAGDGSTAYPCGMCLQVMNEFMKNGTVILEEEGGLFEYKLCELLPHGFCLE